MICNLQLYFPDGQREMKPGTTFSIWSDIVGRQQTQRKKGQEEKEIKQKRILKTRRTKEVRLIQKINTKNKIGKRSVSMMHLTIGNKV